MTKADRSPFWHRIAKLPASVLVLIIKAYRVAISPMIGAHCRYQPTCSAYAIEAIERHGSVRGSALAARRLLRCHPIEWLGGSHGYDPVPEPHKNLTTRTSDV